MSLNRVCLFSLSNQHLLRMKHTPLADAGGVIGTCTYMVPPAKLGRACRNCSVPSYVFQCTTAMGILDFLILRLHQSYGALLQNSEGKECSSPSGLAGKGAELKPIFLLCSPMQLHMLVPKIVPPPPPTATFTITTGPAVHLGPAGFPLVTGI